MFSCGNQANSEQESAEEDHQQNSSTSSYQHEVFWNYQDEFTTEQEDTLKLWIEDVKTATENTLGVYPFDMHIFFYKSKNRNRPVSFGHTSRKNDVNEIHFYVNPQASFEELRSDWTAPHEMSHLAIPFLGKKYKWFSEGFATYLSRRIMIDMGYFTEASFDSMYVHRITEAAAYYSNPVKSFAEVSKELFDNYKYSAVYWGGAGFFYTVDKQLQEKHDMRFEDLLKAYLPVYRLKNKRLKSVVFSFDELLGEPLFKEMVDRYETEPALSVLELFR